MSHSFNSTLLSHLGFADPDKRESEHDLACQYLIDNALSLYDALFPIDIDCNRPFACRTCDTSHIVCGQVCRTTDIVRANQEVLVTHGNYRYRRTIGFLDAVICLSVGHFIEGCRCRLPLPPVDKGIELRQPRDLAKTDCRGRPHENGEWHIYSGQSSIAIEVKVRPVRIGDILRQLNLYRGYYLADHWVVATCYSMSERDRAALQQQDILHVRLGERFQEWKNSNSDIRENIVEF
nr:hypothetical protein 2 [Flavobacteriaceae bacterium]